MTHPTSKTKNAPLPLWPFKGGRLALVLVAALATMALIVPTAMARPAGPAASAALAQQSHAPSSTSTGEPTVSAGSSSLSDWGRAGIGLGAVLAIAAIAGLTAPRRRIPASAPATGNC